MKKVLAVVLAVMMMFSCFAVASSAFEVTSEYTKGNVTNDQVAILLNFNGGSSRDQLPVYNNGNFEMQTVSGSFIWLPESSTDLVKGSSVQLPVVTAPSGQSLTGWRCSLDNKLYAATDYFVIPEDHNSKSYIQFIAEYTTAEAEGDTMATIMGILIKIFGALLGFLLYNGDTEAGVAFMENALAGILG